MEESLKRAIIIALLLAASLIVGVAVFYFMRNEPVALIEQTSFDGSFTCDENHCRHAQLFSPPSNITVGSAAVRFGDANGTIIMTIRTHFDEVILASTRNSTIANNGWTELELLKPVPLYRGKDYALQWDTTVTNTTQFLFKTGDPYLAGAAWEIVEGRRVTKQPEAGVDYVFRIFAVKSTPEVKKVAGLIEQPEIDDAFNCTEAVCSLAQSFVPTIDMEVDLVAVRYAHANLNDNVTMTIRFSLDGSILSTTSNMPVVGDGWTELALKNKVELHKGERYFLQWDTEQDLKAVIDVDSDSTRYPFMRNNPYPEGEAWAKTNYGWTVQRLERAPEMLDADYAFKIIPSSK